MNNLNTEIIFNILQYLDIDDLINYSITNKLARNIFNDPYFWKKKILSLKIPDICLDYYKLNCTTYILLSAQEEKDICSLSKNFIPLKDFVKLAIRKNKLYLIKGLVKGSYCWDIALYEAGASNNKEIINHFLNISKNYEMILKGVIKSGNKNIFNEICKKYKPILDWQVLIEEAAYQGNKDFFEYIYLSKKNKWNWVKIVICAIKSGNPEFLHYIGILAQKNKIKINRFINSSNVIKSGSYKFIKSLIKLDLNEINVNYELIKYCLSKKDYDVLEYIENNAFVDFTYVLGFILRYGLRDLFEKYKYHIIYNNCSIILLCKCAIRSGKYDLFKYLISNIDHQKIYELIHESNYNNLLIFLDLFIFPNEDLDFDKICLNAIRNGSFGIINYILSFYCHKIANINNIARLAIYFRQYEIFKLITHYFPNNKWNFSKNYNLSKFEISWEAYEFFKILEPDKLNKIKEQIRLNK